MPSHINLDDVTLFGNDAAEDESEDVFTSYFFSREEVDAFELSSAPMLFLRAYRGEGKSAIIRHAMNGHNASGEWATRVTGASLSPNESTEDPNVWNRHWQTAILNLVGTEIGNRIGFAWTDDQMSLVEQAERNGFKQKSLVSSVFSRMNITGVPEIKNPTSSVSVETVTRYMEGKSLIWVYIDDIDEDFRNTSSFRQRIASFFTACRTLCNSVPQLRIRTSIRPNVWRILRAHSESLSKVDQYAVDIAWQEAQIRSLLSKRIEGYINRTGRQGLLNSLSDFWGPRRENKLIELVFDAPMKWGYDKQKQAAVMKSPARVLATLSRNRPRWLIEFVRLAAAKRKKKTETSKITSDDVWGVLAEFGRERIEDLSAEYRSECSDVQEMVNAFANTHEDFKTDQLISTIRDRVMGGRQIKFASSGKVTKPVKIAAFLYEIGFLTARKNEEDGSYTHYAFAEKPELLHNAANLDHGLEWEIHPIFRQALGMRDREGRKIAQPRK